MNQPPPLPDATPEPSQKSLRRWPALLILLFVYPLGLFLLWRSRAFSRNAKVIAALVFGGWFLFVVGRNHAPQSIPFEVLEKQLEYRALHGPWKAEVGLVKSRLPQPEELKSVVQALVDKAGGPKDEEQYYVEFYLPGMAGKSGGGSMAFAVGGLYPKNGQGVLIQYHPDNQNEWPQEYRELPVPKGNWAIPPSTHTRGPLEVTMTLTVQKEGSRGRVRGTTNLPDSMIVQVNIGGGKNYFGSQKYTIKDGAFGGLWGPLPSGQYTTSVLVRPAITQPLSVQAVIGIWGANLAGPLVKDSRYDVGIDVKAELKQEITVSSSDPRKERDSVTMYQRECNALISELVNQNSDPRARGAVPTSNWLAKLAVLRDGDIPTLQAFDAVDALRLLPGEYGKGNGTETDSLNALRARVFEFVFGSGS